jgi:hypothetical protein
MYVVQSSILIGSKRLFYPRKGVGAITHAEPSVTSPSDLY